MNTTTPTEDYPVLTQVAITGNTQRESALSVEAVKALNEISRLRRDNADLRARLVARGIK